MLTTRCERKCWRHIHVPNATTDAIVEDVLWDCLARSVWACSLHSESRSASSWSRYARLSANVRTSRLLWRTRGNLEKGQVCQKPGFL